MPPLVLILDIAGVRPLDDPQPEGAGFTWLDELVDVEFGSQMGVLADTDVASVQLDRNTLSAALTWATSV